MTTATLPMEMGDVFTLQEIAYTLPDDALTAEKAHNLEFLVDKAVQLAGNLQNVWSSCTREGCVWETRYYLQRVRFIESLASTVVDILLRAQVLIARIHTQHAKREAPQRTQDLQARLDAPRAIAANARKLLEWLNRTRPPVDAEMIRRAQDSLSRDEGTAIGDIIARLEEGGSLAEE